jgi:L-lactate dehydrogenase (cytochrome)
LGAGGQAGVEAILRIMHDEIKRGMILMGCRNVKEITRDKVIFRKR